MSVMMILVELGILMSLLRLLRGPGVLDRVAAADLLSFQALCWIGLQSVSHHSVRMMDTGLTLALVTFFGTLGLSYWAYLRPTLFEQRKATWNS